MMLNKVKQCILLFLFFCAAFNATGQKSDTVIIANDIVNVDFNDFVKEIEQHTQYRFYYNPDIITSLKVNIHKDTFTVNQLMNQLFFNGKYNYFISGSNNIYVFINEKFTSELPIFEELEIAEDENKQHLSEYIKGRDANAKISITIGRPGSSYSYKKVKVTGQLSDAETNETLVGATLLINENGNGAASDINGNIVIYLQPGTYSGVFQSLGMQEVKASIIVHSAGNFQLQMTKKSQALNEVVVTQTTNKRGSNSGMESVSFLTMKEIPALLGEKDVLRIAQMLPGIVSVGEGSGGLNVRGGNADQNLFYVNNIPVYNSSHLFGFFSSVNANIIEKFTVYKGQVPVSYGGRLSSVFEVETRNGNKKQFFTQGAVSPISANIVLETPIIKNKASLSLSTRSTYSNWILGQMKDPELRNSRASFYDVALGFDYVLGKNDNLKLFGYYSNDFFSLNKLTDYNYGNSGASLKYTHRFNSKFKASGSFVNSNYHFGMIEQNVPVEAYKHDYTINHNEFKTDFNWQLSESHDFNFGFNSIIYRLNRGTIMPHGNESLLRTIPLGEETGIESAVFLADQISIGSRLKIYAGLRYSFFNALGPKMVYLYHNNHEILDRNIIDSLYFSKNQSIINYSGPELRTALDFKTSINGTLKLTYTQMRQYLFMLSNTVAIAPTDQWKMADYHIKPQYSVQYSLGYYYNLPQPGILASVELYQKKAFNIVEYKDGADFLATANVESNILQGNQQAYGAEFMISKEEGMVNGWISYTYSRSIIRVDGEQSWQKINLGRLYPSNYDKPHVVNLVLNYKINRRFSLSSNVVYNSGRPITFPVGYYFIEGKPYIDYSARNEYRIPDYFRTDFSVKIEGNLRQKKVMHSYWMFSVYNATGRNNVNSIFFKSEDNIVRGYQYSIIGVPIFTISWNWKLGNYENN